VKPREEDVERNRQLWFPRVAHVLRVLTLSVFGLAAAQAPVEPTSLSPNVLLEALGNGSAMNIGLPRGVRVVHVAVTRGDVVLDTRSTIVEPWSEDSSASIAVSVGALGPTLECPFVVFVHTSVTLDGRVSQHGMNRGCVEVATPVRLVPWGGFLPTSFDVEQWYAVDSFVLMDPTPGADRQTDGLGRRTFDEFVFHVYLSTDDGPAPVEQLVERPR